MIAKNNYSKINLKFKSIYFPKSILILLCFDKNFSSYYLPMVLKQTKSKIFFFIYY